MFFSRYISIDTGLMTGLRRVVGHTRADSGSPLQTAGSIEELDTLHLHPGIALSPMPGMEISPRKRKSADAFDLGHESTRYVGLLLVYYW